jgi:UDP-N-acetyl-2-amino-2-deoxyglucuronate dehydrogenase
VELKQEQKRFAVIGVAGYIAPRHLQAIRDTGHILVAACDPNDSVGILDSYFPETAFFTEFERFDRHLEKLKRAGSGIDYLVVCSPNYLHDAHVRYGLRLGADIICEKPLVLNPWNLTSLEEIERETGKKVWSILQLRLHPKVEALKSYLFSLSADQTIEAELTYITPRGNWYHASWKGDLAKSGGIMTNIGIHLFDLLIFLFGPVIHKELHIHNHGRAAGMLQFRQTTVRWFLSIESETVQQLTHPKRMLKISHHTWDFSEGFTTLHTASYEQILSGGGFTITDTIPSLELVHQLRQMTPDHSNSLHQHPLCQLPLSAHPFAHSIHSK